MSTTSPVGPVLERGVRPVTVVRRRGRAWVSVLVTAAVVVTLTVLALRAGGSVVGLAHETRTRGDADAVGSALRAHYVTEGRLPTPAQMAPPAYEATLAGMGVRLHGGAVLRDYRRSRDGTAFSFCVVDPASGAWTTFDSSRGGYQTSGADATGQCRRSRST